MTLCLNLGEKRCVVCQVMVILSKFDAVSSLHIITSKFALEHANMSVIFAHSLS